MVASGSVPRMKPMPRVEPVDEPGRGIAAVGEHGALGLGALQVQREQPRIGAGQATGAPAPADGWTHR